jgi:hypothetical protein
LAQLSGAQYVLHLEDDWLTRSREMSWLTRAHRILEERSDVGQVRLRHIGERVLRHHMLTGKVIDWQEDRGYRFAAAAHFTFNPNLLRAKDVSRIYPCDSEAHAQKNYMRTAYGSAQLVPGVFCHLGHGHSLVRPQG